MGLPQPIMKIEQVRPSRIEEVFECVESVPPPFVQRNMELSLRLIQLMEHDTGMRAELDNAIVIHIVPDDEAFNDYNRRNGFLHAKEHNKPIVEVHWRRRA